MADNGRVAVVTGGGRGIGRGVVYALARLGLTVGVNFRADQEAAAETCSAAEALGARRAVPFRADIADARAGGELVHAVLDTFGRIDVWVNNAGVAPETRLDLLDTTVENWDRVLNTNLRGPFFLTQAVARALVDQATGGAVTDAQIVFITSVSAQFASVRRGEYCVSKAGLSMVARLFATRLADHGIRVAEIRPGIIATAMTGPVREQYDERIANGLSLIRRWGEPDDVGRAVAALVSGALPYSTGEVIHVDGGLHVPRL